MAVVRTRGRTRRWDYLPLATASLSMLLLLAVLPSALNLPQSNPAETLEYAPVPPEDDVPPSPEGNFSSLGLGSTRSLGAGAPEPGDLPPVGGTGPVGAGRNPRTKRCVGNPPRQTEDPSSPPCVAFFRGDNGGATAKGVTEDEVVVLVYVQASPIGISAGVACHDDGCDENTFYDLGKPPSESSEAGHDEEEAYWPHVWRTWQRYFNDRYQTYGRFVHIWFHYGSPDHSPEQRRADVAEAAARLEPFAVIADLDTNGDIYGEEWARRGKAVFMAGAAALEEIGFDARFFRKYPGGVWAYNASIQEMSENYGSFLCSQVVPHPVSYAGDGTNGQPRRLGLLRTSNPNLRKWIEYGALVKKRLEDCGADIAGEYLFDRSADADAIAALMRQDGVTTIIYLTTGASPTHGTSPGLSHGVARQVPQWRPEWVVQMENTLALSMYEDPNIMQYARNFSLWPRAATGAERPCEQAYLYVEPEGAEYAESSLVCYTYNEARMLFIGIQVAGPRLTLKSLDVGMHAIPEIPSGDPRVPACFYKNDDYTCVKDAQVQWWDPAGRTDRASQSGCWRSMDRGRRYLSGDWPVRDVEAARHPSDACNIQGSYF